MGKKAKERKRQQREAQASIAQEHVPASAPAKATKATSESPPPRVRAPKAATTVGTSKATATARIVKARPGAKAVGAAKTPAVAKVRATVGKARPAVAKAAAEGKDRWDAKAPTADSAAQSAVPASAMPGQLATRLNSVAIHLLRRLQREDTRLGLSGARLSALSVLVFGGPRTLGKLADAEGVSPPSMTRLVTAMETDGLVTREKNATDGRSVIIRASAEGERILIRGREQRVHALSGWLAHLTPGGLVNLDEATATLEELLKNQPSEPTEATKPDRGS